MQDSLASTIASRLKFGITELNILDPRSRLRHSLPPHWDTMRHVDA